MCQTCPECGKSCSSYKGYAHHYSSTHSGHALVALIGGEELRERYATTSEKKLAEELDVSRNAVKAALRSIDAERRGYSEAEYMKNSQMSEDERRKQTEAARRAHREKWSDGGYIEKWMEENPGDHREVAQNAAGLGTAAREENGMAGVTGQEHPNWRGGKSIYDAVKKQLRGNWRQLKVEAKRRDGHYCQACGAMGCQLDSHHIIPIMSGGINGFWNLMTLCESCHRKAEEFVRQFPEFEVVLEG